MFTFALHLFQMGDTYDLWGRGKWQLFLISVGVFICCVYSFVLVTLKVGKPLEYAYKARHLFTAIYMLVGGTIFLSTAAAGMAYAVADQLAIYTISESVLTFSMVILIPFTILAVMTSCSYNLRYYEIYA